MIGHIALTITTVATTAVIKKIAVTIVSAEPLSFKYAFFIRFQPRKSNLFALFVIWIGDRDVRVFLKHIALESTSNLYFFP
jgi:hypothetical protein